MGKANVGNLTSILYSLYALGSWRAEIVYNPHQQTLTLSMGRPRVTVPSCTAFPIALAQSGAVRKDREELPVHSECQQPAEGLCEAVT